MTVLNGKPSEKFKIIDMIVSKEDNILSVQDLCKIAGVSRSGYYKYRNSAHKRAEKELNDIRDFNIIKEAYEFRGYDKGARGIHMRLLRTGVRMNVKKIRRLMDKYGLKCPIRKANPYRRMAKALRTETVFDNVLDRKFKEYGPRTVLLTDITYIPIENGFCYLSTIIDGYTKQVLSYVLSDSLEIDFVLETIEQLVDKHGIEMTAETLVHSDQGAHYTSYKFIELLQDKNLRQSMSRKGNCWDNSPQESFYGHMKSEIQLPKRPSYGEVSAIIDDWMDYYNNDRYQWQLGKLSPNEYYEMIVSGYSPLDDIEV